MTYTLGITFNDVERGMIIIPMHRHPSSLQILLIKNVWFTNFLFYGFYGDNDFKCIYIDIHYYKKRCQNQAILSVRTHKFHTE